MKYTPKTYVEALAQSLFESLKIEGSLHKSDEIISSAQDLFLKKSGARKIIIETARPVDTTELKKVLVRQGDMVKERINPKLVAGVKITIDNEKQFDFSLKEKLDSMF